jgi:hypothetical protein
MWGPDDTEGPAHVGYWYRYERPQVLTNGALDPLAIPPLADSMPPALVRKLGPRAPRYLMPSLDLTVYFLGAVTTEWVMVESFVERARDGYAVGSANLWAEDGSLIARASQATLVRRSHFGETREGILAVGGCDDAVCFHAFEHCDELRVAPGVRGDPFSDRLDAGRRVIPAKVDVRAEGRDVRGVVGAAAGPARVRAAGVRAAGVRAARVRAAGAARAAGTTVPASREQEGSQREQTKKGLHAGVHDAKVMNWHPQGRFLSLVPR